MLPAFRTTGRLANAGASLAFMLAVGRTFAAEEMSQWAVLGSAIGALTVLCGYPIRLGIFQFYPRYAAAGVQPTFRGHLVLLQVAMIGAATATIVAFYGGTLSCPELMLLCASLSGRIIFELVAEILRAERSYAAQRLLLTIYVLRSAALTVGAAFAVIRGSELDVSEALGALSLSFLVPALLGVCLSDIRPMMAGTLAQKMWRRVSLYLRYTLFLAIPFALDSVTIYVERHLYAVYVPPGPAAEYFIWADLSRYYFTLMGVLYSFEVLPDVLAHRHRRGRLWRRHAASSATFILAVLCGLFLGIMVKTFEPGLVLGSKQSYADIYQFLCIPLGAIFWMARTQVLGMFFQMKRQTYLHSLLAVICLAVFGALAAAAWAAGTLPVYFYFLVPAANLVSLALYLGHALSRGVR